MKTLSRSLSLLFIATALVACASSHSAPPASHQSRNTARIMVLRGVIDTTSGPDGKPRNAVSATRPSGLHVRKILFTPRDEAGTTFEIYVTTDPFPTGAGSDLVLQVGKKLLVPNSRGGDEKAFWSLGFQGIDRKTAEALNGGPIATAPKTGLEATLAPATTDPIRIGGPAPIGIVLTNHGTTPLNVWYATDSGVNSPHCRDTQLTFRAVRLEGTSETPVPPLAPAGEGYITHPFLLKSNARLSRSEDLGDWLSLDKPGIYRVSYTYTVDLDNPNSGATPTKWPLKFHGQFTLTVVE